MISLVYLVPIAFVALFTLILLIIVCILVSRVLGRRKAKHIIKFVPAVEANTADMEAQNSIDSPWLNRGFEAHGDGSPNTRKVHPQFEESPSPPLPTFQRSVQSLDQSTTSVLAVEQLMRRSFITSDELKSMAGSTNEENVKVVATRRDFV